MKFDKKLALSASLLALSGLAITAVSAEDWPEWGKDSSRNMTAKSKNIPIDIKPGTFKPKTEDVDMSTTKNVKWVTKLGSQSYGNPTVSKGKVFVGTNNETPRDAKYKGDRAAVYCLDEKTGDLIWQFNCPKLGTGKVSDWEYLGICSSPAVDGDRIYIVTNRCQVICLDVNGLANGNQGFKDEAKYYASKGKPPVKLDMKKDGDILWIYDLREELGVFPHNITSSSILVAGDTLFVNTS
ncbi:MAG: PQQ-binding-like beta-propeller repeat protein, partial [Planctomycetota bacterium]|nr:PQQ-binding-like beta-propeller repeat protein [Planctomycetota bacterium]